ncbi:MAG: hypothetical protein KG003_15960 [Bacteroidetes bacterium]|nr:hypothetical protein [Bacteroidota bacterium]
MKNTLLIAVCSLIRICSAATEIKQFDFYGRTVMVPLDPTLQHLRFDSKNISFIKVSTQLKAMHKLDLPNTFRQLRQEAKKMKLDRVGYFQLIKVFSMKAFPEQSADFRKAIAWYGLRDVGIDVILVGSHDYFNLFVRLDQEPDGCYSMSSGGKKYFSVTKGEIPYNKMEVFRPLLLQDSAMDPLSLDISCLPELGNSIVGRSREFEYNNRNYVLNTRYNANLVSYMNDLPRFRIGTHLYNLRPSEEAGKSLDDSLKIWMLGMSYSEKLSFILNMVQRAFPYKADRDYRPREKRNFIEQTLADDYTDCEDKAALFCYLAKNYLNSNTILIYSQSATHVTAALELEKNAPGYTFKLNNKGYLICEAACTGYKPGATILTQKQIKTAEIYQ